MPHAYGGKSCAISIPIYTLRNCPGEKNADEIMRFFPADAFYIIPFS
jgi:hypothetical protein